MCDAHRLSSDSTLLDTMIMHNNLFSEDIYKNPKKYSGKNHRKVLWIQNDSMFGSLLIIFCMVLFSSSLHVVDSFQAARVANRLEFKKSPLRSFHGNIKTKGRYAYVLPSSIESEETNYLVTDSLDLSDDERPSLWDTLANPRDILAVSLLSIGIIVSISNVLGIYDKDLYLPLEAISIVLGMMSGIAAFIQVGTGYNVNFSGRRGLADDLYINIYSGSYAIAVSWLALRASDVCFESITRLDIILPWVAAFIFLLAGVLPAVTLFNPMGILNDKPPLSETELVRTQGLFSIGILACVFAPDCVAFGLGSNQWWDRVAELHPSQRILESSTSLFALYANEASMIGHRCSKSGVAPFRVIVPVGAIMCVVLAVLPCACALHWLGNDISFFSFYRE